MSSFRRPCSLVLVALTASFTSSCTDAVGPALQEDTPALSVVAASGSRVLVCPGRPGAFLTIDEALAGVAPGGTVEICPGIYPEKLLVDEAVTLRGRGEGVVIAPSSGAPDRVIEVATTGRVTIEGLAIDYPGLDAIVGTGAIDLRVARVRITRAGNGVHVTNDASVSGSRAQVVIRSSAFDGGSPPTMQTGPFIDGDVDAVIAGNVVRRTNFSCIQIQSSGPASVTAPNVGAVGNDVDQCGTNGGAIRVRVNSGSEVSVIGNHIRNSGGSPSPFGILFGFNGAPTGRIELNRIVGYVQASAAPGPSGMPAAIAVVSSAQPLVRANDIVGNAHAGLRATTTATVDARCNWWGSASGPSGNGPGSGDAVFGNAAFTPWATASLTTGWQPGYPFCDPMP